MAKMKSLWEIRKIHNKLVNNLMMSRNFEKIFLQWLNLYVPYLLLL